jgi:hypothetical protein
MLATEIDIQYTIAPSDADLAASANAAEGEDETIAGPTVSLAEIDFESNL